MRLVWLGALLATLLLLVLPAAAEEAITSFASAITLATDGSVDVTETIAVNAEGRSINHGIYRDLPTLLSNDDKSRVRSNLNVLKVTRDGADEPFSLESIGNGFTRIRIGSAEVFVDRGPHRYTIRYTMTRMGRSFADHDELFWNVTGNYWVFPISNAVATVTLPEGAVIDKLVGYTGKLGSLEHAVTAQRTGDNTAFFRATRELAAGEGLSVAVSFQPGILLKPQGLQSVLYWLSDHRDLIVPLIGIGLVLLYNFLAWSAVGRDPKKGTIIPLFHEPKGSSPGLVHYIHNYGWAKNGWTAFTATLFDLGVKGLVTINNEGKTLTVTRTKAERPADLSPDEAYLLGFVNTYGQVVVDKATGPKLNEARAAFLRLIDGPARGVYFVSNFGYIALGVLLAALVLLAMVGLGILEPTVLIFAGIAAVVLVVLIGVFRGIGQSPWFTKVILVVWAVIFGGNLLGTGASFLSGIRLDMPTLGAMSIVAVTIGFGLIMRAPTVPGRKAMDEIDGFKMYLETAEQNRLNMTSEPPMSVERFERILPYAIALGVEKPWSQHFEGELARNAVEGVSGSYSPLWYSGTNWSDSSRGISNTVSSVATGMSAAMIAAQPSSSSGSGFSGGGGGGSGGGGGGGGGGGW